MSKKSELGDGVEGVAGALGHMVGVFVLFGGFEHRIDLISLRF